MGRFSDAWAKHEPEEEPPVEENSEATPEVGGPLIDPVAKSSNVGRYTMFGDVTDPKAKRDIAKARLDALIAEEEEYYGERLPSVLERRTRDPMEVIGYMGKSKFLDSDDEEEVEQRSGPTVTEDMQPVVHHDVVEWHWPPKDSTPLTRAEELMVHTSRITIGVMRVGFPAPVRVRLTSDMTWQQILHHVADRVSLARLTEVLDEAGRRLVRKEDIEDGMLLIVRGKEPGQLHGPSLEAYSAIRPPVCARPLPCSPPPGRRTVVTPDPVLSSFQRRQLHYHGTLQDISHAKNAELVNELELMAARRHDHWHARGQFIDPAIHTQLVTQTPPAPWQSSAVRHGKTRVSY